MYRALMEASAFGLLWIVEIFRESKVPVKQFVATGGLPHHNPLLVQIYADVLGEPILIHPSKQGPALGAAILGVLAAGSEVTGFDSAKQAIDSMAGTRPGVPDRQPIVVEPNLADHNVYRQVYAEYRRLCDFLAT